MPVSFDLFGTLVTAERPTEPWQAAADSLAARGISVPDNWEEAYRTSHIDTDSGAELSLVAHTQAALESVGVSVPRETVHAALLDAFDGPVTVRPGAPEALATAADTGRVGLLSNCSLPGLVAATLERAEFPGEFDAIVTSVDCGWRKPHDRAFDAVATALDSSPEELVHVGDDPRTDGGGRTCGATVVLTDDVPLTEFPDWLEAEG